MSPLRIMVMSDCEAVRTGISALLERCSPFQVIAQARSAAEGIEQASARRPDVVVLDMSIQDMSSADACSQILHQLPKTRIFLLSSFDEDKRLSAALSAGAAGYVLKRIGISHLIEKIMARA